MFSSSQKLHTYLTRHLNFLLKKAKNPKNKSYVLSTSYAIIQKMFKNYQKKEKEMEVGLIAITNKYWAFLPLHAQLMKAYF